MQLIQRVVHDRTRVCPQDLLQLFEPRHLKIRILNYAKALLEKEISYALFQNGPLKVPGPDAFPARIF
jgi:hypothetical protein